MKKLRAPTDRDFAEIQFGDMITDGNDIPESDDNEEHDEFIPEPDEFAIGSSPDLPIFEDEPTSEFELPKSPIYVAEPGSQYDFTFNAKINPGTLYEHGKLLASFMRKGMPLLSEGDDSEMLRGQSGITYLLTENINNEISQGALLLASYFLREDMGDTRASGWSLEDAELTFNARNIAGYVVGSTQATGEDEYTKAADLVRRVSGYVGYVSKGKSPRVAVDMLLHSARGAHDFVDPNKAEPIYKLADIVLNPNL